MTAPGEHERYAFWTYETIPGLLGGEVLEIRPNGRVLVKGYEGFTFKPIFLLNEDDGMSVLMEVKTMTTEYSFVLRSIEAGFKARKDALFEKIKRMQDAEKVK